MSCPLLLPSFFISSSLVVLSFSIFPFFFFLCVDGFLIVMEFLWVQFSYYGSFIAPFPITVFLKGFLKIYINTSTVLLSRW